MYKVTHKNSLLALSLVVISLLSGLALSSTYVSAEDTEVIDTIELTVPIACTMGGVGTNSHNATISPGTYSGASGNEYEAGIGKTTLTSYCNDNNGFSIYAIGFTNDSYEGEDHTKLIGQNTNQTISTKVYASGDTASNWSMKLTKVDNPVSGDPITYNPENMTLTNSFNTWHEVPDTYTKVAEYHSSTTDPSTTDTTLGAKLETTYATFIASDQVADTYTGQVKYTMVHPYNRKAPEAPYFEVLYTGRPLSNEPGEENPVKIRMSELPESGTYNLLGTEDGLYNKLTPDTYYGGYYKNVVDSPGNFTYTNELDVYDGTNFNWLVSTPETTDAAAITPEDEATYYVKEVNSDRFLRWTIRWTSSVGKILTMWFMTDLDDDNYYTAGFDVTINNGTLITYPINEGFYYSYKIIPKNNPNNSSTVTAASIFSVYGDNNQLGVWRDFDNEILNNEVETFTLNPFWVTKDGYKVNGRRKRNQVANGWNENLFNGETERIPISIIKWQEPNP